MNALRKIGLFIFGLLLFITLPLNTFVWTTRQTLLDRQILIGWLDKGKVYDNIADAAAQIAEDSLANRDPNEPQTEGESSGQMPDTATLINAAKVALPPSVIKQNVETILNSAYDWLEGKTDTIVLNLDLNDEKTAFVNALGDEAIARAASLPTCTEQLPSDFDPLSSACIPSGANVSGGADKIKNELFANKDFFPETTITGADFTVGEEGNKRLLTDALSGAPKAFGYVRDMAYVITALLVIYAVAIFFLGKTRRSGLKVNAWLFGLAGVWALILGGLFKISNNYAVNNLTSENNSANIGQSLADPLINQITGTLFTWHATIGGAYLVVAVLCIIAMKFMKVKTIKDTPTPPRTPSNEPKTPLAPKSPTPKKPASIPKPNNTKLVQ